MGGGVAADGSNMIYNLQSLHKGSNKVTTLQFMNARMLCMSSPYSIKHVQVICIFNFLTDYYFNI